MNCLFLIGAVGLASAIDCSQARPWRAELYPQAETQVHYQDHLYKNLYWTIETMVPGESEAWQHLGECDCGSATEYEVNCEGIQIWSPMTYTKPTFVIHDGFVWKNQWYAEHIDVPGRLGNWLRQGACGGDNSHPITHAPHTTTTSSSTEPQVKPSTAAPTVPRTPAPTVPRTPAPTVPRTSAPTVPTVPITTSRVPVVPSTVTQILPTPSAGIVIPNQTHWPSQVYAPFVDVGLAVQPNYHTVYEKSGTKHFMLAFITAQSTCTPMWAGVYPLNQGPYTTFDKDLEYIRSLEGDVGVSFGGLSGTELADVPACHVGDPVANVKAAYLEVIRKYNLKWIDFDIESNAISEVHRDAGWKYRFEAVKQIQAEYPDVRVSWTLPIVPTGLLNNGLVFIEDLMKSGVRIDMINVMTMDYGQYYSGGKTMHQCEIEAIDSLAGQMLQKAQSLGRADVFGWKTRNDIYPLLGSTPMIGVNDVNTEIYSLNDAEKSMVLFEERKLGWWAAWSLTRDLPCGGGWAQATCSSGNVQNSPYDYAEAMNRYTKV